MVLGADAPRETADYELKLSLSMGEGNAKNSIGKLRISVGAQRDIAEAEPKVDLSMESNM